MTGGRPPKGQEMWAGRVRGFELEEPEDLGQRRIAFRKIEPLSD